MHEVLRATARVGRGATSQLDLPSLTPLSVAGCCPLQLGVPHWYIRLLQVVDNGVSQMDRIRNEEVRRRAGIEKELASRSDQRVLRWFGHVERMDDYRMARRVLMAKVSGGRVRGRPRLGWMGGVMVALGNRGMTVEAARQCAKDRKAWRALVHT